jgi:signal transduction histidine kinase
VTTRHRVWWSVYGLCTVAVLAAVGWISRVAMDLEHAEARARVEVAYEQSARLALWRMDSWFAPILAAEAARGVEEYTPFRIGENLGAVLQSELVDFRSRYVKLHFELVEGGGVTSPQAPQGTDRARAEGYGIPAAFFEANDRMVEDVAPRIEFASLNGKVAALEARMADVVREELGAGSPSPYAVQSASWAESKDQMMGANRNGTARRQQNFKGAREPVLNCAPVGEPGEVLRVGPFVAVWLDDGEAGSELAFVRRIEADSGGALQGFLIDWPALEGDLLEQTSDLFTGATLRPVPEELTADDTTGRVLATVPVAFEIPPPPAVEMNGGPTRQTLWITWAAVLAALLAAGVTLRASIAYGERRSRFASSVTHELRTPLTTFRMYAEMLADGMVEDPRQQAQYLRTLHAESERLTSVVENVLAYSRLEQGRATGRVERLPVAELVERLRPRLERRVDDAGAALTVDVRGPRDDALSIDVEAVGQIVLNLVDNACKYGASSDTPRVEVVWQAQPDRLLVDVSDHGPGVDPARRRAVFEPFDRGGRDDGSVPGIGLGLALSRGLARQLGGDVTLEPGGRSPGATFRLSLPC